MKKLFIASAMIMVIATILNSCSNGSNPGGSPAGTTSGTVQKTAVISGTVTITSSAAGTSKLSKSTKFNYTAAKQGSDMDQVLSASGVKTSVELPPLINATMKLYNADRPDWIYPVAQVFSDAQGKFKFDTLTNADLNTDAHGNPEYVNGDPIPAGNYTIIAANDTTISGGKQFVAVQAFVKYFEGAATGNDLVVQDSDAEPSVQFMIGLKPNNDGTFGGAGATLAPNAGIQIIFDMAMARLSVIDAVTVATSADPTTPIPGTWKVTPDLQTATFYPTGGLIQDTDYVVTIQGGANNEKAAVNVYGKPISANVTGTFTSEHANDTTPPQNLVLYKPQQTNVAVTTPIQIASPEPIDINTISVASQPSIGDKPSIQYIGTKPVLTGQPDFYIYEIGHTPLKLNTNYTITISNVRDMAGNQISLLTFTFKTEATTNGVTTTAGALQDNQLAVKDVFGKWVNAMNARNSALLTTYMTGNFYWMNNGWSTDDLNHDGRLNLAEFRRMLQNSFSQFDYCGTVISGDTSDITINGASADITFTLSFNNTQNLSDPACAQQPDEQKFAVLDNINGAWLISRGSDVSLSSYPPPLDAINLVVPSNGTAFPEPTPSKPLNPDFSWTAVSGVKTYALILMEKGTSDKGYVALVDASAYSPGDQVTFTYTDQTGYTGTSYVMPNSNIFGFSKNVGTFTPGGYYVWSVLGFKTSTVANFELDQVTDPTTDLGASSMPSNFSVANNAPPSVLAVTPANTSVDVTTSPTITAAFSEAMDPSSINDSTFTLATQEGTSVSGTVTYDSATFIAKFVPSSNLDYATNYVAKITTGAKDIAANSLAVEYSWGFKTADAPDTTAPVTTASPAGGTYNSTVNVALSANEDVKYILYTTDPASSPTITYTSPISLATTTTLRFFAEDLAGNKESVKTETYTIDTTKPVTVVSPPGGYFNATPVNVTLTTESGAKIYATTDGTDPSTGLASSTTTTTITISATGSTQLKFFAVDAAGNAENIRTETYIIDTTPPDTSITTNPDNPTKSKFANFTFTSNETNVTYECSLDGGGFTPCSSPYSSIVSEGTNTFSVRAKDLAGNYDATPATYTWTYDITPPTGSIGIVDKSTMATGPTTTSTSVELRISATDNLLDVDQMQLSRDGQAWYDPINYATTVDWTLNSGDGTKAAFVRFKDAAGNWSGPYGDTIVLDTTAPETNLTQTPPLVSGLTFTFAFSASEPVDHYECRLTDLSPSDSGWQTCSSNPKFYSETAAHDGFDHTFYVRAVDKAGLVDQTPAYYTWKVDTLALVTEASPVGGLFNSTVNVTLRPTGTICATNTYWCTDSTGGSNCTPGTLYTGVITISASDTLRYYSVETGGGSCTEDESNTGAGGTGTKEQVYTIDETAPDTTISPTSGPAGTVASTSATFYFSGSDNLAVASFECQLDSGGYAPCNSPISYAGLANGSHTFSVYAKDTAGNIDPSPATRNWSVDLQGPVGGSPAVSINSGATYANSYTVQLDMNASDASGISKVLVSNDGTAWTSYVWTGSPGMTISSWSLTAGDGPKVVYVQFQDTLGNLSSIYSGSIKVDTVPPNTVISGAPPTPTTARSVYFYFYASEAATFECYVPGLSGWNSWTSCSSPQRIDTTSDGTYTFYVRAIDTSGLIDTSPASYTWTLFTGYWDSPGIWDESHWGN